MQTSLDSLTSLLLSSLSLPASTPLSLKSLSCLQAMQRQKHEQRLQQQQQKQYTCNNNNYDKYQPHKRIGKRKTTTKTIAITADEQHLEAIPATSATKATTTTMLVAQKHVPANVQQPSMKATAAKGTAGRTAATTTTTTVKLTKALENLVTKYWRQSASTTAINSKTSTNLNMSRRMECNRTALSCWAAKRSIVWSSHTYPAAGQLVHWIFLALLIYLSMDCAGVSATSKEAYFNGSAYLRLLSPMPIWDHSAISFRSCRGGEILAQQYNKNSIVISVLNDFLQISLAGPAVIGPNNRVDVKYSYHLLDNRWHTIQFKYEYGNLYLYIDRESRIFANSTYNSQFLTNQDIGNEAAILILGNSFTGCLQDGPGLQFINDSMTVQNAVFGPCPLGNGLCSDHDIPLRNQDFCGNDPCMGHGLCISHTDGYECRCTARYSGKNCQMDNGSPCDRNPCSNSGTCYEDRRGDYQCFCTPNHTGKHCETEININPLCQVNPCANKGACVVAPGSASIECECPKGYAGKHCEIDMDDCASQPCQNNGKCMDLVNGFVCDCANTGFMGPLCQTNIDECETKPCHNGKCFDTNGWFICQCSDGWGGELCEKPISCQTQQCLNGGTCLDKPIGFQCLCPPGFSGELCQQGPPPCPQCPIDSECIAGKCVCKPGSSASQNEGLAATSCEGGKSKRYIPPEWLKKKRCELKLSPIGHCVPIPAATTNTPPTSPSSATSAVVVNPPSRSAQLAVCTSDKCSNGGTCKGLATNYTCICASGFKGFNCELPSNDVLPSSVPFSGCKCMNGGTCSLNGTHCYCPVGYSGERCEKLEPCTVANCQEPMMCSHNKCVCPENKICTACAAQPCRNGGVCSDIPNGDYECKCPAAWTGRNCMKDVDECLISPKICGNGICRNEEGSYKCFCTPGFTGIHCDSDVDECLSHPCKNGATCHNKINSYECVCPPGYMGFNCGIDIDECASNPCFKGSTCVNLINNFTCSCIPGMTGRFCEIDIDDCVSGPCKHGGQCIDELGGFHCNCTSTGYEGRYCELNIDECATNQCANGAECIDQVNDYFCKCFPGFRGKSCEIDINECESNPCQYNGNCLERSNITLYSLAHSMDLPNVFSQTFSFENASGYECVCVSGITGKNCEININECESNPCSKHGTCNDGIGSYTCECDPGFEGTHCEINIDECERYNPCGDHGTCIDQTNDYECDCDAMYGGKNCSVPLIGCVSAPCLNGGVCKPYLVNETEHLFNCSCQHGFQGDTCQKTTTISMVVSSLITVKTQREEGYDINLQFRTTLPNGVLAFGTSGGQNEPVSYILELINGRLNLHSSLLNKWEGVFIGSNLNDSNWHKVFVAINTSHLVLSANDEQAIFPVGSYETSNGSQQPSFPLTYLGGTIPNLKSYLRHLTHRPSSFVGCMQDIVVNGKWIFPDEQGPDDNTTLTHIQSGCPRTAQCNPNPCHSNGKCTDLWHTFSCTCQRPHFGYTCKYNITAATFGHENTSHSAVIVETNDSARRAIRSVLDISMFIRTRQPTGQVFYLGSDPRKTASKGADSGSSYVAAKLQGGELLVKMQFNGTPEAYTVGGNKLDNGYNHLIEVVRNQTLVQVKLNGTEYFRKTLSSTGLLDAQVLYLGGPAPTTSAGENTATVVPSSEVGTEYATIKPEDYFKGIIQDVKVSNGSHTMIVELYPLEEEDLALPPPFGVITIDRSSVLKGEVSDDLCRKNPCRHNAECRNTWNDYTCKCPNGYKGKDCQEIEFCQLVTCPGSSVCQNLDDGYECLTNITFRGNEKTPLAFSLSREQMNDEVKPKLKPVIEIAYRTRAGGTLLYVENELNFFEIGVNQGQVTVTWKFNQDSLGDTKRFSKEHFDGIEWSRIYLRAQNGKLEGGWKGWESMVDASPAFSADIDMNAFQDLISSGAQVHLGGMPIVSQNQQVRVTISSQQGSQFKGCLGEARVGDLLLPYFTNEEMYPTTANFSAKPQIQFHLDSARPDEGCILCFKTDCKNGGTCSSPSEDYACTCVPGYDGDDCSNDIDECATAMCENNSTCVDKVADFLCDCLPGYDGRFCENNIDECGLQPCHNGGNCTDLVAAFHCDCTDDYAGPQCDILKQVTCENQPCKNNATCQDGFNSQTSNNFTCSCLPGYEGALCDTAFCEHTPCQHGGLCIIAETTSPTCQCSLGYTGHLCESDINECDSNPCLNSGKCTDLVGGYKCNCTETGFEGDHCEVDIDECAMSVEYCGGLGRCINQPGSFKCICQDSFCGAYCNFTDPCKQEEQQLCMNGGSCIEACGDEADYYCNCTEGYTGKNCTVLITSREAPSTADIAIIVVPIVVVLLLVCAGLLVTFLVMARNKRATRGTYSPSAQEYCNPRLEMDNVLKPPPEERLI